MEYYQNILFNPINADFYTLAYELFLNQANAGRGQCMPGIRIAFVHERLYVCVSPPPRLLITEFGVI